MSRRLGEICLVGVKNLGEVGSEVLDNVAEEAALDHDRVLGDKLLHPPLGVVAESRVERRSGHLQYIEFQKVF